MFNNLIKIYFFSSLGYILPQSVGYKEDKDYVICEGKLGIKVLWQFQVLKE
jgi:hypothetical protein